MDIFSGEKPLADTLSRQRVPLLYIALQKQPRKKLNLTSVRTPCLAYQQQPICLPQVTEV